MDLFLGAAIGSAVTFGVCVVIGTIWFERRLDCLDRLARCLDSTTLRIEGEVSSMAGVTKNLPKRWLDILASTESRIGYDIPVVAHWSHDEQEWQISCGQNHAAGPSLIEAIGSLTLGE